MKCSKLEGRDGSHDPVALSFPKWEKRKILGDLRLYAADVLENPDSVMTKVWHVEKRSHSAKAGAMNPVPLKEGCTGSMSFWMI